MTSELLLCVGQENYDTIPENIAKLIEEQFSVKQNAYDQLVSETSTIHADYEQRCYELDKKIIETSTALEKETAKSGKLSQGSEDFQIEMKKLKESNNELVTNLSLAEKERSKIKRERDAFQEERLSIEHILQKRETELAKMTDEWKVTSEKLNKAVNQKNDLEMKYDDLQNRSVSFEFEQKKIVQEKEMLEGQNEQLTAELSKLSAEFSAANLEKSGELVHLKGKLEEKMGECNLLSSNLNNLRTTNAQYQEKINQLLEKLNKAQGEHASMDELYKKELQSQSNLADLYKSAAQDAEAKATELSSAVSELQHLIGSSSEANAIAQQQINELEIKNVNNVKEIENLKKEIERANDLLKATKSTFSQNLTEQELSKLCPTAAMASKFIKSGMTLTEIYSKYIETSDELDAVKLENKRLNEAMDAILSELNEKAPVLKKQREDYERALATISQLTSQMDNAVIECQHLQTKTDDANRKFSVTQRDNERLRKETADLSKQVQCLLKELSQLKGGTVTMGVQSSDGSMQDDELSSTVITSSDVISSKLVTFKDIAELQQQNKKLLAVVRELSEEREKDEVFTTNTKIKELSNSLEETKNELENIKLERSRQGDMIEALLRQRDMYRVLLANDPNTSIPPSMIASPSMLTNSPKFPSSSKSDSTDDTARALTSLQEDFNEYKIQSQENVKIYKKQIEELQKTSSELRTTSAKFEALAEFRAESGDILKQNNKDLKNENQILKERSNQQQMLLQKQELSLVDTCNKLSNLQQSKAKNDAKLEAATTEINMLKRTEERLRSEISFSTKEQRGQSVLLANLQKVQQTVERQEFEVRSQMRQQIESQEGEIKALRTNLQQIKDDKQDAIHSIEKQLVLIQNQYEKECEKYMECNKTLQAEIAKYQNCELEKNQLQAKLTTIEKRMKNLSDLKGMTLPADDGSNEDTVKELKADLHALKQELEAKKMKLDKANIAIQQQKAIAVAAEESLKQANTANKELSAALNTRLSSANEQILQVEKKAAELYSDNLKLTSNKTDLINEVDRQTEGLNKQIAVLQTELDDVMNQLKTAQKCEQEARRELQEQALAAKEANDNYQREMILHGNNVQKLLNLKQTTEKNEKELADYQNKIKELESQLNVQKELLSNVELKYKSELDEVKERSVEMEKQNTVLHERIQYLSNQLSDAQQKASRVPTYLSPIKSATSTSYLDGDDKTKSDEQLMNIVKFLRKEKALYESKFDVANMESNRLKHQLQNMESQVKEIQTKLHDEQQKSNQLAQKEMEHEATVRKLTTLDVLSDSNKLLRDERDRLVKELNKMSDLLEDVQKQLAPLQSVNNDLTLQNTTLKSEKLSLEQDVQRWQQRVQTLQNSKKQDPEELKRHQAERQQLLKNLEKLAKDLQEKKSELSAANVEIRNSAAELTSLKTEKTATETKLASLEKDLEEKNKIIAQVKRVGRRYKSLYEELQKKTQEAEKQQTEAKPESSETAVSQKTEDSAKISLLEASIVRANTAKTQLQKQLATANQTIEEQTKKIELLTKEISEAKDSVEKQSSSEGEVASAKRENDDLKKMLSEKDDKSKKLLTVAKNRLEQIRKELADSNSAKEQLQSNEVRLKQQLDEVKASEQQSKESCDNLQKKVDDLQKQLQNFRQLQTHKMGNEARSRQIPQYPVFGAGDRKAANVRPISSTLVGQVSPLRGTKLARVMPEPQQDVVEGTSTSTEPLSTRVSSPQTQVSTSHISTVSTVIPQSSTQPTRALVHPQRHRVSSGVSTASNSVAARSSGQTDTTTVTSVSSEISSASAPSSSTESNGSARPSETEQAIVSSSDDQTMFHEEEESSFSSNQQSSVSQTESSNESSTRTPSEAASSSSATKIFPNRKSTIIASQETTCQESQESDMAASSSDSKFAVMSVQAVQDRKRTHDHIDDEAAASSSDSRISLKPVSKRQRNSPDQSSESVSETQPQVSETNAAEGRISEVKSEQLAEAEVEVKESSVTRVQPIRPLIQTENSTLSPATSTLQPPAASVEPSQVEQSAVCASTSDEQPVAEDENAIVISSDEETEAILQESNEAEQSEPFFNEEYQDGMLDEVSESNQAESAEETVIEVADAPTSQLPRPELVIDPPPPDSVPRNRIAARPAPLTPGLPMVPTTNVLPSTNDDGDGIVPCTPTLPSHAHDDNYQTINSPYLTSGSAPPIQFRFEDVNVPAQSSLGAQRGLGSVDNTLMDLGGTDEETPQTIPNIDVAQSSDSVQSLISSRTMVTSSFVEDVVEEPARQEESDDIQEEDAKECSSSEIPEPVAVRNLQNLRGRRIRLIKSRPRGRGGGNSPTTSNN